MATFKTMIKNAYVERLAKYGFKKIKGKNPYFVRVVNDEVIHVITYYKWHFADNRVSEDRKNIKIYKYFICGSAMSLNMEDFGFEKTPYQMKESYVDLLHFERYRNEGDNNFTLGFKDLRYEEEDEKSKELCIEKSLKGVEEYILPVLDKITDNEGVDRLRHAHGIRTSWQRVDIPEGIEDIESYEKNAYNERKERNIALLKEYGILS